ncbi:eukaryotic translation initiation factor [Pseudozyma hubeiensis SY62]|uniref:Eukaryotic translation initiation factor n=1 Tax=Pseudozyma hubeiensis (strain SY62) TaxID=1305764 RepID=R9NY26_PSEHS|nr:eukaryotic translation initiation factor [Pseudozyma hubeiensis SY62]GAC93541.1 eukaryotic translation initiation factor [Pseudozyma hubeiensis SY62]
MIEYDQKKLLKAFKKEFACNGTIVDDEELGQVIQLQGDQRQKVATFIVQEGITPKTDVKGFPMTESITMSSSSTEAGPSRLSAVAAAPSLRRIRHHRQTRSLAFSTVSIASNDEDEDDDESRRVGCVTVSVDWVSEPVSLYGAGLIPSSVSHRFVPFSLRSMASEMVRPPEVSRPTPPERRPAAVR